MYYILERELKRMNFTREMLATKLGISISTVSCKLNDKSEFTIKECREVKKILQFDGTIDELFKSDSA